MEDGGPYTDTLLWIIIVLLALNLLLYIAEKGLGYLKARRLAKNDAEGEIISMVNESHEQGYIEASEAEMITNIFEFGDKQAQDIMTHRSNIVAIDVETTLIDAIEFMLQGRHSRYPVYDENLDQIVGILHLKDALRKRHAKADENASLGKVEGLLREVKFIPETRKLDALFHTMRNTKTQMVMVIDEYGQTSGLVAMEDILEEIVGNLMDEYDEEEGYILQKGNNKYIINGLTPLEELERRFSISFEETDFETLNGYMIHKMKRIPAPKERFEMVVDDYKFKVVAVENKMIKSVVVTKLFQNENVEIKLQEQKEI